MRETRAKSAQLADQPMLSAVSGSDASKAFIVRTCLCDTHSFRLAEESFWHNPAKMPSPIK